MKNEFCNTIGPLADNPIKSANVRYREKRT